MALEFQELAFLEYCCVQSAVTRPFSGSFQLAQITTNMPFLALMHSLQKTQLREVELIVNDKQQGISKAESQAQTAWLQTPCHKSLLDFLLPATLHTDSLSLPHLYFL